MVLSRLCTYYPRNVPARGPSGSPLSVFGFRKKLQIFASDQFLVSFPFLVALELWLRFSYRSSPPLYGFLFCLSFRPFVTLVLVRTRPVLILLSMRALGRRPLLPTPLLWSLRLSLLYRWLYCYHLVFSVFSLRPLCRLSFLYADAPRMGPLLTFRLPLRLPCFREWPTSRAPKPSVSWSWVHVF